MKALYGQSLSTGGGYWSTWSLYPLPVYALSLLSLLFSCLVVFTNETAIIFCIPQLFKLIDALCFQTPGHIDTETIGMILYQLAATHLKIFFNS